MDAASSNTPESCAVRPAINQPSLILSWRPVTLMQADMCVQTLTCASGRGRAVVHITVRVNVTFFSARPADGSLSELENNGALVTSQRTIRAGEKEWNSVNNPFNRTSPFSCRLHTSSQRICETAEMAIVCIQGHLGINLINHCDFKVLAGTQKYKNTKKSLVASASVWLNEVHSYAHVCHLRETLQM